MSKLQKAHKYVGPISTLMIFGSLDVGVWLFAEYLAHHQSSNWAKHTWFTNPNYHVNFWLTVSMMIVLAVGLFMWEHREPKVIPSNYFYSDPYGYGSDRGDNDYPGDILSDADIDVMIFGGLMIVCTVLAAAILALVIVGWVLNLGSSNWQTFNAVTHSGGPNWHISMWQVVVVGWLLVADSWSAIKYRELPESPDSKATKRSLVVPESVEETPEGGLLS